MYKNYYIYIVTNQNKTVLYIGLTNNIQRRLSQHYFDSENAKKSFAGKYNYFYLVYYQVFEDINAAIKREKEIKGWRREKKNQLISEFNPNWDFLNHDVV